MGQHYKLHIRLSDYSLILEKISTFICDMIVRQPSILALCRHGHRSGWRADLTPWQFYVPTCCPVSSSCTTLNFTGMRALMIIGISLISLAFCAAANSEIPRLRLMSSAFAQRPTCSIPQIATTRPLSGSRRVTYSGTYTSSRSETALRHAASNASGVISLP